MAWSPHVKAQPLGILEKTLAHSQRNEIDRIVQQTVRSMVTDLGLLTVLLEGVKIIVPFPGILIMAFSPTTHYASVFSSLVARNLLMFF